MRCDDLLDEENKLGGSSMLDKKRIEKEFSQLKEVVFLNVSSVVMPPQSVQEAYFGFTKDYIRDFGEGVVEKAWKLVGKAREEVASLIGAFPEEIAFVKNTSEGMGIIANGYPFQAGEEVIIVDQEHSSTLFAWIGLQAKGVELQVISSRDGDIEIEDIFARVTHKTKAIVISAVQFTTGFYVDLKTLGEYCRKHNILFIVDGIQAVGRLEVNVKDLGIDYLACGGNKGLLATLGAGFVFCDQRLVEQVVPPYASYQSVVNHVHPPAITQDFSKLEWHKNARRFESGNLNYAGIAGIQAGAALVNYLGIRKIEKHILKLDKYLTEGLRALPLNLKVPKHFENHSGVICVYYPGELEKEVISILGKHKIYATMRGGYIRFGINFYNTKAQMDVVIKALTEISKIS